MWLQGTTGNPKGAVLTQGALASATYSNLCGMDVTPFVTPVVLSFLPLAHIYGVRSLSQTLLVLHLNNLYSERWSCASS